MRSICVWAYHSDFGTLCRNAQLDQSGTLSYPAGDRTGQAGWHVAVRFNSLHELAGTLNSGLPMPRQFCGNWFSDCEPIRRGEIRRLAIMAHGDQGGVVAVNGRGRLPFLAAESIRTFHADLHAIGLYTSERGSTVLLMGCLAGQGPQGTRLLRELSRIWTGRRVVGFATIGYRHPGEMKRRGEACELPGMRETNAPAYLYANPYRFDSLWTALNNMPWASEGSPHAKVVLNGNIEHLPAGEPPAVPLQEGGRPSPPLPVRREGSRQGR